MSGQPNIVTKSRTKLIWLLFMHRHGDRAPLNMAPRDRYNNIAYWPDGFGNLNNAGRARMYKLGRFIRRRYDNFMTDNMREVYSRSSDVDRCIESSNAVLAGLYPPSPRFLWSDLLPWLPAPVHTVPAESDLLLNDSCRRGSYEFINENCIVQHSEAVEKLYADSVEEREILERELGYDFDMFYNFKCIYSTLDIEERNGLQMPAWWVEEFKQKMCRFSGIAFALAGGGTENLKRIHCADLLDDLIKRMKSASIDEPAPLDQSDTQQPTNANRVIYGHKIVHYSTHDTIIAAFLEALNVNAAVPSPPGFGATFFIELYVDLNQQGEPVSEKYLKLFYMNDSSTEEVIEKKLPGCKLNEKGQLTLDSFRQYVAHLLPGYIKEPQ